MTERQPPRRRFIAGAVCPRCAKQDKIVVDLDTDTRHCVSCGFSEDRPSDGGKQTQAPQAKEVLTRVTRPSSRLVETPAEAVTLVNPGQSGSQDET
ncbi:MAG: YheV family putative metal-binding protein [Halioglobus sp.]